MSKVYIINNSGHDYSQAKKYGDLVFLTEGLIASQKTTLHYRILADKMKNAQPGDYILITSLASVNCIAGWIMGTLGYPLNLLIHDQKTGKYMERKLFPRLIKLKGECYESNR